jgi:hypothetical protein
MCTAASGTRVAARGRESPGNQDGDSVALRAAPARRPSGSANGRDALFALLGAEKDHRGGKSQASGSPPSALSLSPRRAPGPARRGPISSAYSDGADND